MGVVKAPPHDGGARLRHTAIVVLVGILVGGSVLAYILTVPSPPIGTVFPPPIGGVNATLTRVTGPPVDLAAGRLGVNVRADVPLTASTANVLNATDVRMVRWPGGGLGDRFDPIANEGAGLIYASNGSAVAPATTFAGFASWCRTVGCDAIVTLPAEVDNASLAAAIVQYSLTSLHFRPAYWELGDEPALWDHFAIPWTAWSATQTSGTTPQGFAQLVQAYVAAIRGVDPTTPIVGIGGVGVGGSQPAWIEDDVATNGPNLSAVAIHVYPSGTISGPTPLTTWFSALQGSTSLPSRVNATIQDVTGSCSTCNVSVLVDEFATGTGVPPGDGLTGGYLASYVGAELVQSIPLDIRTLAYYDLQSGTPGAWLSTSGTPSATYTLYQDWAQRLGTFAAPLGVTSSASGLLAALGGNASTALDDLILVNSNSTVTFRLDLAQTFASASSASVEGWNGPDPGPTSLSWGTQAAANFTLAPMSLAIFTGLGALVLPMADRPAGAFVAMLGACPAANPPQIPAPTLPAGWSVTASMAVPERPTIPVAGPWR